jgi:hypothetical protein
MSTNNTEFLLFSVQFCETSPSEPPFLKLYSVIGLTKCIGFFKPLFNFVECNLGEPPFHYFILNMFHLVPSQKS